MLPMAMGKGDIPLKPYLQKRLRAGGPAVEIT